MKTWKDDESVYTMQLNSASLDSTSCDCRTVIVCASTSTDYLVHGGNVYNVIITCVLLPEFPFSITYRLNDVFTCPAVLTVVVQVVQIFQIVGVDDGRAGRTVSETPNWPGRGTRRDSRKMILSPHVSAINTTSR